MAYKYITDNNLENRQNYMYSKFYGHEFLQEYRNMRSQYIESLQASIDLPAIKDSVSNELMELTVLAISLVNGGEKDSIFVRCDDWQEDLERFKTPDNINLQEIFNIVLRNINKQEFLYSKPVDEFFNSLIKSFEVRKKIYRNYYPPFKPVDDNDYKQLKDYLIFACFMGFFYLITDNLKYLNTLIKLNDTLLSLFNTLALPEEKALLMISLLLEEKAVVDLCTEKKVEL